MEALVGLAEDNRDIGGTFDKSRLLCFSLKTVLQKGEKLLAHVRTKRCILCTVYRGTVLYCVPCTVVLVTRTVAHPLVPGTWYLV